LKASQRTDLRYLDDGLGTLSGPQSIGRRWGFTPGQIRISWYVRQARRTRCVAELLDVSMARLGISQDNN
jgi:hypothetical protein